MVRDRGPVYYAKWRDTTGRQVKRRLGPAWAERDGESWRRRRGRVPEGALDERAAVVAMGDAIREHESAIGEPQLSRAVTFADAAAVWLHHIEHVEGCKPSTLADYRYMLAPVDALARKRGRAAAARIMRALGHRPLASITKPDVARFLAPLDAEPGMGPRTVNKHRQVLCSVFEHAMREDTFRLPANPARGTDKRREPDARPIDFYEPEEVLALARAAREGLHRDPRRPGVTPEEIVERRRADEQDAALYLVAAFTGLRLDELLGLRWRNVKFADAKLTVEASWSSGRLSSPKSRKWRAVPLADQPAAVLDQLSQRQLFTARDDLVFCSAVGTYLDASALRRRYRRTQEAAGLRPLRFNDLRHSFGSLVIREFDPVAVKDFMGHAKIMTTERYLHARSRRTDAARLTKAFAGEPDRIQAAA
ncbi:MAG: site-specific integrase [Actinomycetota bacterium]|nr:site-specific integrase [Actinomycetota bacterium]